MLENMFKVIDQRIASLEEEGKHPAVILINASLYKSLQDEMIQQDILQQYGKIRSPHELKLYRGVQIIPCETVEAAQVF